MKTNWYVITGGPSAGKTTALKLLEKKGFRIQHEAARVFIDAEITRGKTIEEIRRNEGKFQQKVLFLKKKIEKNLPRNELIFFDRGIPDSIAYYEVSGLPLDDGYLRKTLKSCYYKKIFLFELVKFKKDYARTDQKDAKRIENLLEKYYSQMGYEVIRVPEMGGP